MVSTNNTISDFSQSMLHIIDLTYTQTLNDTKWGFSLHSHEYLEITYLFQGKITGSYNGRNYNYKKGNIIVKNPNVLHCEKADPDSPPELISIGIGGLQIPGMPPNHLLPTGCAPAIVSGNSEPVLTEIARYMYKLNQDGIPLQDTAIRSLLQTYIILTTRQITQGILLNGTEGADKGNDYNVIEAITLYLNEHYHESVSLESLASLFHFSPYYIARRFKEQTGKSVHQYLLDLRVGKAQLLLAVDDIPIKDIANLAGYTGVDRFFVSFKKRTGYTPLEFRSIYRKT